MKTMTVLVWVMLASVAAAAPPDPGPEIRLAAGTFRPGAPSSAPAWFRTVPVPAAASGLEYVVAIAREPLSDEQRAAVEAAGASIVDYLPVHGYRLRLAASSETEVRRLPFVTWLGAIPPYLKLSPEMEALAQTPPASSAVRIVLFDGEPETRVLAALDGMRALATAAGPGRAVRVTATLPADRIAGTLSALASLPEVEAILPARRVILSNQDAVWVHQSFVGPSPQQTPVFDHGIFGCGQILGIADTAQDYDSCFFRDTVNGAPPIVTCSTPPCPAAATAPNRRKDILYYNWSGGPVGEEDTCPSTITGTSGHGTHTSGSLAGDTTPYADCSGFTTPARNGGDGLAPGAKLVVQELGDNLEYLNDLGGTQWNIADVAFQSGARVESESWGNACYDQLGNCIPGCTAPYDDFSRDADLAMWNHPDLLIAVAAGNSGYYCAPPLAIGSPATAKSVLVVGSVGHGSNASTVSDFTSAGPVEDGRLGPTVLAQGEATVSAASDAVIGTNNCGTCSLDGTSMSTPTAGGLAALVREYFTAGYYPGGARNAGSAMTPSAALLKAILIDSAVPMGAHAPGPDFQSGFGRIQLNQTLTFTGSTFQLRVDDRREGVTTGGLVSHAYDVSAGTPFRATLVWSDYPAALNAAVARVNELKLEVVDPTGTTWFQTLDAATGLPTITSNGALAHDTRNVEERLVFPAPQAGRWIVRVRGVSVPWGPQPLALVVHGALTDCPAPAAPPAPTLATPATHQVQVSWSSVPGAASYDVYRSFGACPRGPYVPVASAVAGTSFLDTTVTGGATYSYVVTAASDAAGACESARSACASVVPTGDCGLAPSFPGAVAGGSAGLASCTINVSWAAASPYCLGDVRYNVYRGTTSSFVPSPSNRIARCVIGTSFADSVSLPYGAARWYIVRAEDATTGHGGPCRGGNEDTNAVAVSAAADGPTSVGTWSDDAGDTGTAKMNTAVPWVVSTTGGHNAPDSYEASSSDGVCADLRTPTLTLADPGQGPQLTFWSSDDLEYDPTGEIAGTEGSVGQVEIAIGPSFSGWTRVPLTPDYPTSVDFPYNDCPTTQNPGRYFTGNLLTYTQYQASLSNWAGGDVKIRFHLSGDHLFPGGHWWIDDLAVTKAMVPGSCTTIGAGPPPVPDGGPVPGAPLRASRSGTSVSLTWDASQCTATAVNVYRGAIGSYGAFTGGTCNLPDTGSATVAIPDNSWFIVAATDGATTDGSYGEASTGAQITYGGASTACPAITSHVTNNGCP